MFVSSNLKNSKLFILRKINDIKKIKTLSKIQLDKLIKNYNLDLQEPVLNLTDFNSDNSISIALLHPNIVFRQSTIDQAAKIALKLEDKKWDVIFLSDFNKEDIYNFLLGWGLSYYNFHISKTNTSKNI